MIRLQSIFRSKVNDNLDARSPVIWYSEKVLASRVFSQEVFVCRRANN